MDFGHEDTTEKAGEMVGFLLSYALFTAILFFILYFFGKLPVTWGIFHVALLTLGIALLGWLVQRLLK